METRAFLKGTRLSSQKANLVAGVVRDMSIEQAIDFLSFSKKKGARVIKKLLDSALANAENNHQLDIDILKVSEAYCGKGMVMKRWRARAKGRPGRINKFLTNITIKVVEDQNKNITKEAK